jgi:Na+-translocating ferredoxin:NAD+ oxidoreductase RnfE subunit
MFMIAVPRQLLGAGGLVVGGKLLFALPLLAKDPIGLFILPPGALLTMALLHGLFRKLRIENHE